METKLLKIRRVAWSDQAEKCLADTLGEDRETIKFEVEAGISELFESEFGYMVTRLEIRPERTELVLVAGAGKRSAVIIPAFCEIAKHAGAERVRVHSDNERIINLFMKKYKFDYHETVLIKKVA